MIGGLDWSGFSHLLDRHHDLYRFPVNASLFENLAADYLAQVGRKVIWHPNSHAPGPDIWADGRAISCKSIAVTNPTYFKVSGPRTTTHAALADKIAYLRELDEATTDYLMLTRRESAADGIAYELLRIDPALLAADTFVWTTTHAGWDGENEHGVSVEIVRSMSHQIWHYIPIDLIGGGHIEVLMSHTTGDKNDGIVNMLAV